MGQTTDAELVAAAVAGDRSAYERLAARYRDAAFGVAYHVLGDFETARDAAQEALVKAYVDLPKLRDHSKFAAWLRRITATTAATYRRRTRSSVSLSEPGFAGQPSPEPNPAEIAQRSEQAEEVSRALGTLPNADRLAVILHYVNGYSHDEIGGMLETTASAVKSRIHRARRRLRKEMLDMVGYTLKDETHGVMVLPPLEYTESWVCDSEYRGALRVKGVFGTSATVAAGETYVVCLRYELKEPTPDRIALVVDGVSRGWHVPVSPGKGSVDLPADIIGVNPGSERFLGVLFFAPDASELDAGLRLTLSD